MKPEKTIPATFLGVVGLITYQSFKQTGTLPKPQRFLGGAGAYTMLFLLGTVAPELSAVMSFGLFIAVALIPGILDPAKWQPVGFTLPPGASIGTFGPNGIAQPGTSGLNVGKPGPSLPSGGPGVGTPGTGTGGLTVPGGGGFSGNGQIGVPGSGVGGLQIGL